MDLSHVDAQMHAHTRACVDKHTHKSRGTWWPQAGIWQ